MTMTRVFRNGNSQALRIPQEIRAEEGDFCISKVGEVYIAFPATDRWAPLRQVIGTFPDDFMTDREQPLWDEETGREDF